MKRYSILGIKVNYANYNDFVDLIVRSSQREKTLKVAPVASHPVEHAFFEKKLKAALEKFDLILPDGQSLVWAARVIYGFMVKERIYGPELFLRLLNKCREKRLTVLLYGNETDKLAKKIRMSFKGLKIIKLANLKGKPVGEGDALLLTQKARKYRKAILFIGIGSPAQHFLGASLRDVRMPVVAVGAAFDFLAGTKKQAPNWIQDIRLEWLFRLLSEPRRLWKRYLIDASVFVLLVCMQKLGFVKRN